MPISHIKKGVRHDSWQHVYKQVYQEIFLNIELDHIQDLVSINSKLDDSIIIKLRLKSSLDNCPICKQPLTIHGYYDRKLTHSTLINRKCVIIYRQRRYYCKYCEQTFHENNPFINTNEHISLETKINVLKDLKFVSNTYFAVTKRYYIAVTLVMFAFDIQVQIPIKKLAQVMIHYIFV